MGAAPVLCRRRVHIVGDADAVFRFSAGACGRCRCLWRGIEIARYVSFALRHQRDRRLDGPYPERPPHCWRWRQMPCRLQTGFAAQWAADPTHLFEAE